MTALHLVEVPVRVREFTEWALRCGFLAVPRGDGSGRPRDPNLGYAMHAALAGVFGDQAPRPFRFSPAVRRTARSRAGSRGSGVSPLTGYARSSGDHLSTLAQVCDEEYLSLFEVARMRCRPVPEPWPAGLRLRFDLEACPVRRRLATAPFSTNESRSERPGVHYSDGGREVDAFQLDAARAEERGEPIPGREESYRRWLSERLRGAPDRPTGADLLVGSVRVESYRSVRLLRRPSDGERRTAKWLTRPEVRFSGHLRVTDSEAFTALLGRGVGRHCGFGFGMLLLAPA